MFFGVIPYAKERNTQLFKQKVLIIAKLIHCIHCFAEGSVGLKANHTVCSFISIHMSIQKNDIIYKFLDYLWLNVIFLP